MTTELLINSAEYDSRFASLIRELESCAYSNTDCDLCPLETDCHQLFDSLADRVTHYRISEAEYKRFFEHFHSLKKQLALC